MNEEYQSKLNELNTEIESLKNMHENDQRYITSQKELIISLKRVHDVQRYLLDGSYNDYNSGFTMEWNWRYQSFARYHQNMLIYVLKCTYL